MMNSAQATIRDLDRQVQTFGSLGRAVGAACVVVE
jgi:hypothetical protein